jgi:cell division initiation protein
MIDLTPLDVRKKKGDFRRALRGYEAEVVDDFLDLVAERMEELVRENAALRDRVSHVTEALSSHQDREKAVNEALVSAQQLREEVRSQASREGELLIREAKIEAERILSEAKRQANAALESTRRIHGQRGRFLRAFRAFVERQMAEIEQEEERLKDLSRAEGEAAAERKAAGERPPAPRPPAPRPGAPRAPGAPGPGDRGER